MKKNETALDRITAKLRTVLRRRTRDIILAGNILIEAWEHLDHGGWQSWLTKKFDLSIRSAQNYVAAAEYVERQMSKSATVADFSDLAPTVLYALAAGHYNKEEEAEILAATHRGRVDQDAARAICERLAPVDDDGADDDQDHDDGDDGETAAAEDSEIAAILDGPPPAVPPPAPIPPPPDFALRAFDQAISALKQLMTKPSAQFVQTIHNADDLEGVESFIRAVTKACVDDGAHRRGAEREPNIPDPG
jgi:hypothetical protein